MSGRRARRGSGGRPHPHASRTALSPARAAALSVLAEAGERDARVRDLLGSYSRLEGLDGRDAGFARRLALGTMATRGCLDELIDAHLDRPSKVSARVRWALRIAVFEFAYLGTPAEAAVSQGVELVRSQARAAAGLANAVLRRVAEDASGYLAAADAADPSMRALVARARRAGLPVWLLRRIDASLGERAAGLLLDSELEPPPIAAHLNPRTATGDIPELLDEGDPAARGVPQGCRLVSSPSALIRSGALVRGDAVVCDLNAQTVALAAVRAGTCLEVGSGRGTKTFVMAAEGARRGLAREHVALDLYEAKTRQNLERLRSAGLDAGVRAITGDATDLDAALACLDTEAGERRLFDTVLVDAPCSGTGTMRRHPEIPWRLTPEEVDCDLPALQLRLLNEAAGRVAPGGALIYATCSVLRAEDEGVVESFLDGPAGTGLSLDSTLRTVPAPGAFDGHFMAVLHRARR